MKSTRALPALPVAVHRALRKLGQDIRDARRRRRIPAAIMAERASISRTTLNRIEKGDAALSAGNYAAVLFTLGLIDRFAGLADATQDTLGGNWKKNISRNAPACLAAEKQATRR